MKSIEFDGQNVVFAKDQDEYANLPAHSQSNGLVTFCMKLDAREFKKLKEKNYVNITVLNFNRPVQPICVMTEKPEMPVPFDLRMDSDPFHWDKEKGTATFKTFFTREGINKLKKDKKLWITFSTFGAPLQPISQTLTW